MSLLMSRRDLAFLLYDWLDAEALVALPRYAEHGRETFDAVLDTSERIAEDLFAPHAARGDREEPQFDGERVTLIPDVAPAVRAFADAGLIAAGHDEALGGMRLPKLVEAASFLFFQAANIATSAYPFLTAANANLLVAHGSAARDRAAASRAEVVSAEAAEAVAWDGRDGHQGHRAAGCVQPGAQQGARITRRLIRRWTLRLICHARGHSSVRHNSPA